MKDWTRCRFALAWLMPISVGAAAWVSPWAAFTLDDVTLYAGAFVFLFNATLSEP